MRAQILLNRSDPGRLPGAGTAVVQLLAGPTLILLIAMSLRRTVPSRLCTSGPGLWAAALLLALAGCSPSGDTARAGPPGGGMPAPQVGVVAVQPASLAMATELPGRLEAWRVAQVRARVSGIVQRRLFTEGAIVRAGDPLFQLDAEAYRAGLASAEAGVARADAGVAMAQAQVERNRPLAEARAISAQEWQLTQTTLKQAQAELATAHAAAMAARINLDYAAIKAPINGRIGRALVSEGALVGPADASPLAVIQQTDPLYVNITQSATELLRLRRAVDAGRLKRNSGAAAQLRVLLEDGSEYPLPGKLLFTDPTVDAATGQVSLRAELPNPQGLLLPGLFVKVRLAQASTEQAIRLPQQAVTRGGESDTVMVLGADNKPVPRPVKIGGAVGSDWVVLGGLNAGERVIVDGFQKMRPGAPVTPVPWPSAEAPGAAASTPQPATPSASAAASR